MFKKLLKHWINVGPNNLACQPCSLKWTGGGIPRSHCSAGCHSENASEMCFRFSDGTFKVAWSRAIKTTDNPLLYKNTNDKTYYMIHMSCHSFTTDNQCIRPQLWQHSYDVVETRIEKQHQFVECTFYALFYVYTSRLKTGNYIRNTASNKWTNVPYSVGRAISYNALSMPHVKRKTDKRRRREYGGVLGLLLVVVLFGHTSPGDGHYGSVSSITCCTAWYGSTSLQRLSKGNCSLHVSSIIFGRIASGIPWFLRSTAVPMQLPIHSRHWCWPS